MLWTSALPSGRTALVTRLPSQRLAACSHCSTAANSQARPVASVQRVPQQPGCAVVLRLVELSHTLGASINSVKRLGVCLRFVFYGNQTSLNKYADQSVSRACVSWTPVDAQHKDTQHAQQPRTHGTRYSNRLSG